MESLWTRTSDTAARPPLYGDTEAEVAVIGGGMAGILTALLLHERGLRTVVLEAERVGAGQTCDTTAKLTSQHGAIYAELLERFGREKAQMYADANQRAIQSYRRLIEKYGIDCDFEQTDAILYSHAHEDAMRREAEAAVSLGLPASFTTHLSLPFRISGAVRFTGQAQFHPLKLLYPLADLLTVYERTPVERVQGHCLITPRGRVSAEKIVFACHYPFVNFPGMYFARMHQERSYVIALENAAPMDGMWIGAEQGAYSFRNYGPLLLLGGGGHRCGENSAGGRYDLLRQQAARWFPGSREVAHWSAQDCVTADSVPYIGPYAASRPNWYVATGFQKWGMTSSMVAAMLLRDRICGKENPWAEVFDPGRFDEKTLTGLAQESGQAVKGLAKQLFQIPAEAARELPPGHGGVVFWKGKKLGVYKDESGALWPVDIRCPHLGCQLEWNPDERSWDCPCHGSRFDYRGKLISGPAQENITIQT